MPLLMLDNYDSFTYNLVQYLGELGASVEVVRNDVESVGALLARRPEGVVISPGPGQPDAAGVSVELVRAAGEGGIPVLGVCLGHQAIGVAYGGRITRAASIMHGKVSRIKHDGGRCLSGSAGWLRGDSLPLPGHRPGDLSGGASYQRAGRGW